MNILFFDIDGTLITTDGTRFFPEDAKEAIRKARDNGNLCFINTGRVYANVDDFIRDVGFDGYVCGCGSYIRLHDEVLYHKKTEQSICREIAYKCREFGIHALFEYTDYTCIDYTMNSPERDKLVRYFSEGNKKLITDIDSSEFIFDKFSGWYYPDSRLSDFRNYISAYFDYIDREGNFCELQPIGHSKASGIEFLLDYFDMQVDNSYVFGDGNNDLQMMRYAGHSVCMRNGSEEALKTAEYITESVTDGGIAGALKHYGLI
ncbi:MAG: HAD-IIB family hydrolase [Eubacterium sp.]|nr:HAD-IIB family hydrolase [Eubacterium sp.]